MKDETQNAGDASLKIDGLTALAGGRTITVKFNDGRSSESVLVRQLPVRDYEAYLTLLNDEAGQVALLCNKPIEWVESLTMESFTEAIQIGDELNADFFAGWYRRRMERAQKVNPGSRQEIQRLLDNVAEKMVGEILKNSLPNLPSTAGSVSKPPAA